MSLDRGRRAQTRDPRVALALPLDLEAAAARGAADEGEAQEGEGLRLAEPARSTSGRRVTAELDRAASQPDPPPTSRRFPRRRPRPQPRARSRPPPPPAAAKLMYGKPAWLRCWSSSR